MTFAQPIWLLGGLILCCSLTILNHFRQKKKRAALAKFASNHLLGQLTRNISTRKRRYKHILLLAAVFLLFVALARPQYGHKWIEVKRKGIDLLFALDTSKSMLAEDIKPNRLKRAHFAILDFVQQLEGDRVGLLPFAGSAYLMCPLTMDYSAFEQSLQAVNTGIIPRGGTNIAQVIDSATQILFNNANHKILIILTDGENLEGDALAAAVKAAEQGLTIHTIGVGSATGELVPIAGGQQGFVKDASGSFVTSKLDEATLREIAEKTGGIYAPLGATGQGLETIYQEKLALIPKEELAERRHKVPLERFQWPLALALLILLMEFPMSERKNNRKPNLLTSVTKRIAKKRGVAAVALVILMFSHAKGYASPGEDAYSKGDFLQAGEYYQNQLKKAPDDPKLNYNYGTSAFKNNMFDDAIDAFTKALRSDDIDLQKKAYYNKGNSHYHKGAEMVQAQPENSVKEWQQALEALDAALELAPDDARAKRNHQIISERLKELEKQLENQPQNNDKQSGQNQEQKEQQPDKSQNRGEGEERSQDKNDSGKDENGQTESSQSPQSNPQDKAQQAGEQEDKETDEEEQPVARNQTPPASPADQEAKDQAVADARRREQGKMTKEEAEQLLNALKNEEGELNFIPKGKNHSNNEVTKDW